MPATQIKSERLDALYAERVKVNEDSKKILDACDADKRPMSAEEQQQWDAMDARIQEIGDEIDRREKSAKRDAFLKQSRGRIVSPGDDPALEIDHGGPLKLSFGKNRNVVAAPGTREWRRGQHDAGNL